MKRGISALLVLALTVLLLRPVFATEETVIASGTCGDTLTWTLDSSGTLIISGNGDMKDFAYYSDRAPWYDYAPSIKTVVLEDGVTSIGNYAFNYCYSLKEISIPYGVTKIGFMAFEECTDLESIVIPDSVTVIAGRAFTSCHSLTSITIPASVIDIGMSKSGSGDGSQVFDYCTSLTGIWVDAENSYFSSDDRGVLYNKDKTKLLQAPGALAGDYVIPDSVTEIGSGAFVRCEKLTNITIPDSVTKISSGFEHGTFSGCDSLISVTLPSGITAIEWEQFLGCSRLESITIPDSVTSIAYNAFGWCESLSDIVFCGDAPSFAEHIFWKVTATAYYPYGNETWTEAVMQPYDGDITWVPSYEVLEGADSTAKIGAEKEVTIQVNCGSLQPEGVTLNGVAVDTADYTASADGTVITLHPDYIKELAAGEYTVIIHYPDNVAMAELVIAGIAGDINGDNTVNNKDLTRLFQYLSDWDVAAEEAALDVNGDGSVNNKDLTRLFQYLSDWNVEIY